MESALAIPEPHSFDVRLSLGHRGHVHDYDVEFREHEHDHDHSSLEGLDVNSREYQDAHEKRMRTTSKTFCESQRNHRTNNPVRPDRRPYSLPGSHYRFAALHPGEGIYARCRAGTVFQHRFSDHAGFSGRSGGFQRSSGNQTLEWPGYAGAAGSILLKRTDCTCRHLHGLSRLDRRNELIFSCMNSRLNPPTGGFYISEAHHIFIPCRG